MKIHLIAAGTRMPAWVEDGYRTYATRLSRECQLLLHEIPLPRRGKNPDIARLVREEGAQMLAALPTGCRSVSLEVEGTAWSTGQFARQLDHWLHEGVDVALLVGGPDGLAPACRAHADHSWSLSPLTLPHPLVRVIVAEQLFRAWSIRMGHPYHRAAAGNNR